MIQLLLCAAFFHIERPQFHFAMKFMAKGCDPFEALHRTKKLPWLPRFRKAKITKDTVIMVVDFTCPNCNFTDTYHVAIPDNEIIACGQCTTNYDRRGSL